MVLDVSCDDSQLNERGFTGLRCDNVMDAVGSMISVTPPVGRVDALREAQVAAAQVEIESIFLMRLIMF